MPLTRKIILALSVWLVVTVVSLVALTSLIINKGFAQVETAQASRNVIRVANTLEQSFEDLGVKLSDWAFWDDTFRFASEESGAGSSHYQSSNLNDASQDTALNDLIVLQSSSGRMLWGRVRSGEGWGPIPEDAWREVAEIASRVTPLAAGTHQNPQTVRTIVRIGEEWFLLAAAPVLTSNREGPSRGVLVFGRSVERALPGAIARAVALPTTTVPFAELEQLISSDRGRSLQQLQNVPLETWFQRSSQDSGQLYVVIRGDGRGPALTIRTTVPRETTRIGARAVNLFFAVLAFSGIALTGLAVFGMYRLFLKRLGTLSRDVNRIAASGDTSARVDARGSDEINVLAVRINQMLSTLQCQEQKLADWAMQLDSARNAAIEASRAKSAFLANMSHEIRTPMTAILGFADLILDPEGRPADAAVQREAVSTIRRNAEHLLTIINDILDISKIEAGKMTVESIDCPPAVLIGEVRDFMSVRAATKKISLGVEIKGPIPKTIVSDPVRFRQILFNLIGNAIKFTPAPPESPGRVTVRVTCEEAGTAHARLCVDVVDTGIGVSDEVFDRLFDPFVQEDASSTRRYGGTGLGLTISRRLARMLGGDLECIRHEPGQRGTTFRFWLPVADNAEMIDGAEPSRSSAFVPRATEIGSLAGRVLIVEDGPDNQRLIAHLLTKAGAEIAIAADGAQALQATQDAERSRATAFDLILLDMQMPVIDGYEVASTLRARGYDRPIVALTAHAMAGDRERCIAAGCSDYLNKPIDRATLIAACRHWIGVAHGLQTSSKGG